MKIALITDTHLAALANDFVANCVAAMAWIEANDVDLVIHLGDITADAIEAPNQIEEARAILAAIKVPLLCVPGNHDIGDNPVPGLASSHKPLDPVMLARYRAAFGPDRWVHRVEGWTLIGLNAQLFGTGHQEERAQLTWFHTTLAETEGPVGLFQHKPWFRNVLSDTELHGRYAPIEQRLTLAGALARHDLRFVATGHTHQARDLRVDGVEHRWVPSTAFMLPDAMQERIGIKRVGIAVLTLDGGGHRFDLIQPEGMICNCLDEYQALFPKVRAALAQPPQ
jgi:3',5'-cyclic AMP phosphodiesterase CpdA